MTILRVWDDNDDQHYLDLFENDVVKLNYEFGNVQDIGKVASNYSQTFRLPATQTNIDLFGQWFNPNLASTFNPRQKYRADISWRGLPLMVGHIKLNKVYTQPQKNKDEFEIVFFGETSTVAREIGDQLVSDLDLSDLDHNCTLANVLDSINSDITGLPAGAVRYGMADKGINWSELGGFGTRPITSDDYPIYAGLFTPCVNVGWLFRQVIEQAGYYMESTFFDNLSDVYMPFFNGSPGPVSYDLPQNNNFNIGIDGDENITLGAWGDIIDIANIGDTGNFFDAGNNVTLGTPAYYTTPYYGAYGFDIWSRITNDASLLNDDPINVAPCLYDVDTGEILATTAFFYTIGDNQSFTMSLNGISLTLPAGVRVAMGILCGTSSDGLAATLESTAGPDQQNGTGWKCYSAIPYAGQSVNMAGNAPTNYKQIDFIRDCTKLFNLVFVPTKDDSRVIEVEPFTTWITSGVVVDWTEKIDAAKDLVISPTVDIQARNLTLTYGEDKDVLNDAMQKVGGRTYGRMLINNSGNEFATGDQTIQLYAGPQPNNAIPGTQIIVPKWMDQNGQIVDVKPRFVYWNKVTTALDIKVVDDSDGSIDTINYYPYIGHYTSPTPDITDDDLNFGPETPFHVVNATPTNTAFNVYWRPYIDQLYNEDARIMTAYVWLEASDILTLKFNNRVFIKDSYWRINKISAYGVGVDDTTQVEFVKLVDAVNSCDLTVIGQYSDLSIKFEDADGYETQGNQVCCEQYGGEWDTVAEKCFMNIQTPGPVVFGPGTTPGTNPNDNGAGFTGGYSNGGGLHGHFQGSTVKAGASQSFISGGGHIVGNGNGMTVVGRDLTVANNINPHVFGIHGDVRFPGLHLAGGHWWQCSSEDYRGRAQTGWIMMMSEGDLSSNPSEIELLIEGIPGNRISMVDDSGWMIRADIAIVEVNPSTQNIVAFGAKSYLGALYKTGGVAYEAGLVTDNHQHTGDFGHGIELEVDVTTDTTQHRLKLATQSGSGLPTHDVKVTCRISYVQVYSLCQISGS